MRKELERNRARRGAAARGRAARERGRAGEPLRGPPARPLPARGDAVIGEDVLFSGIREIGAQLRARRFSAVELAELALRRLETLGPKLGAVVTRHARARAARGAPREPGAAAPARTAGRCTGSRTG